MYDIGTSACRLVQEIIKTKTQQQLTNSFYDNDGNKQGMPWIYYMTNTYPTPGSNVLHESGRVKFRASFSYVNKDYGILKQLKFKIATYDMLGNFYGFEDLSQQLFLCSTSQDQLDRLTSIGTILKNSCSIDLSSLLNSSTLPRNANLFFEMYMVDYDGDLIDVPIKIQNLINENGAEPNQEAVMDNWILTRRFMVIDTISGISTKNGF